MKISVRIFTAQAKPNEIKTVLVIFEIFVLIHLQLLFCCKQGLKP